MLVRVSRLLRPVVLLPVLALTLAGCVAPKEQTTPAEGSTSTSSSSSGATGPTDGGSLDDFYGQQLTWTDCGDYECATVLAPLDWDDPTAGSVELALERDASSDPNARIGSLLINPGGPGGSGIDFLSYLVNNVLSQDMLNAYDVVAFDPRGVGKSSAVDCGPDSAVDPFLTEDTPMTSQADLDAARAEATAFGQQCLDNTGPLLEHVDTVSAARDMDLMRAVLGDDQLHYLGFSYGTFLGSTYADLYPENVGRLVLDGALDPTLTNDELSIQQAQGFDDALRSYVSYCYETRGCPLNGTVDEGMQQIADLVTRAEARPLDAGDGNVTNGTMAFYGIILTLYDDQYWPLLTQALSEAIDQGTGSMLYEFADYYLDRTPDGTYLSNSNLAFQAINCLDYPTETRDFEQMLAFRDEVATVAPTFADWFALGPGCETWPYQSTRTPHAVTAAGANPILVVGTTGDPATPYKWAQALADQLESGTLLTWEGEGHTAYGRAGSCISDAVEGYLINGTVPAAGTVCS
ncbi:alpha/beta hydrolase [Actinotalea sp. M2MS4P-6]|uniref:alpha/beta hydrolase n=1 Tax=Actinotalea sp. M2MS4P-6 TaxID=2983762 RepID=UPI0021E414D8|nr:alpha/beta hydrolase [Actinotalea sp. M2MS4P-6]MCV2394929.1 alpha/beta hydrolase [Actinotalea sp. M2MS4P-6]